MHNMCCINIQGAHTLNVPKPPDTAENKLKLAGSTSIDEERS